MKKATVVSLFSGGGGWEAGFLDAFGEYDGYGVEFNPRHPQESQTIADCYQHNFPNHKLFRKTVEQMAAAKFAGMPINPDYLVASPECVFSSLLKANNDDETQEINQAMATTTAIFSLQPKHFLLENVWNYAKSNAFKNVICPNLNALGYKYQFKKVRVTVHQSRDRLILWASKGELLLEPQSEIPGGWWWCIEDFIDQLPDVELPRSQVHLLKTETPLWINRVGNTSPVPGNMPVRTFTRSMFTDQKQGNRNKFASIVLPGGVVKQASIECVARLQGFPGWYKLPDKTAIAGTILGNSIPPSFVAGWLRSSGAREGGKVSRITFPSRLTPLKGKPYSPRKHTGTLNYEIERNRYTFTYRRKESRRWKTYTKYVKKELVSSVLSAQEQGKTVEEILTLL